MLTPEERAEIEAEVKYYPDKRAACVEALKIVQRHRGWVPDESIKDIAELLGISPAELDGVATFYNLIFRKPVGKNVILLCNSVSCWIMGYDRLRDHLEKRLGITLGKTTEDNQFTMLTVPCLGTCDHAPALMIGDELYRDLDPEKIDPILEQHRKE